MTQLGKEPYLDLAILPHPAGCKGSFFQAELQRLARHLPGLESGREGQVREGTGRACVGFVGSRGPCVLYPVEWGLGRMAGLAFVALPLTESGQHP